MVAAIDFVVHYFVFYSYPEQVTIELYEVVFQVRHTNDSDDNINNNDLIFLRACLFPPKQDPNRNRSEAHTLVDSK